MNKARVLFLSYDGMTDPLGQSQVLPYLIGLSEKGHHISLLSFEKPDRFRRSQAEIAELCDQNNIQWHPLSYTKKPPVLSTLKDLRQMRTKAMEICRQGIDIIHCRSYIPAMVGLELKKELGVPFLFDMRGFWADERVEGGAWKLSNPMYKLIYKFFKKKEKQFFSESAAIVSLTEAGKMEIGRMKLLTPPVTVIPCSADFDHFRIPSSKTDKTRIKKELGIPADAPVISYLGSIGTWYMLDEMLDFIQVVLEKDPGYYFHFLTPEEASEIEIPAASKGIPSDRLKIEYCPRKHLPERLAASDAGLFFIKPCFSKSASSPTKLGEYLAMGIPVICNSGVGDVEEIIHNTSGGILVHDFNREEYVKTANSLSEIFLKDKEEMRKKAFDYYSLRKAVDQYDLIYQNILQEKAMQKTT